MLSLLGCSVHQVFPTCIREYIKWQIQLSRNNWPLENLFLHPEKPPTSSLHCSWSQGVDEILWLGKCPQMPVLSTLVPGSIPTLLGMILCDVNNHRHSVKHKIIPGYKPWLQALRSETIDRIRKCRVESLGSSRRERYLYCRSPCIPPTHLWLAITDETGCTVSALNISEAGKKMWQEMEM